jgi:16S rRNA (guanine527-N7)-methyltransferase
MSLSVPSGGLGALVVAALGPLGSAPWAGVIVRYLDELLVWNEKMDLTAARTADELVDLTVADAVIIAGASSDSSAKWIDVGTGAGAPGLILAVMLGSIEMTLVEPRDRRVAFLRSAIGKFGLTRTKVERGRSDRLPKAGFGTAVSRATLPPPLWLQEGARLATNAVWVLLAREEAPILDGWRTDVDVHYEWPLTHAPRRAVRYVPDPE